MSLNEIKQVSFKVKETFIFDVKKDKLGNSIPMVIDDKIMDEIESLVKVRSSKNLTEKQNKELLNKGTLNYMLDFNVIGIYTKDNTDRLIFKVTKLCKKKYKPKSDDE